MGLSDTFPLAPPLSLETIPFLASSPSSIRGKALEQEVISLVEKGAVKLAPLPSLGFYSRLFVVMKASGSWRPMIDLSTLDLRVLKSPFRMETLQSVLHSVRHGDWMMSLDVKDAYLQVLVHPDSRKYLRFVALGKVFQFKALCFGVSSLLHKFLQGSWLWCRLFSITPVSAFVGISTTSLSRPPLGTSSSRLWTPFFSCATCWGSWSTRASATWFRPSTLYIWA